MPRRSPFRGRSDIWSLSAPPHPPQAPKVAHDRGWQTYCPPSPVPPPPLPELKYLQYPPVASSDSPHSPDRSAQHHRTAPAPPPPGSYPTGQHASPVSPALPPAPAKTGSYTHKGPPALEYVSRTPAPSSRSQSRPFPSQIATLPHFRPYRTFRDRLSSALPAPPSDFPAASRSAMPRPVHGQKISRRPRLFRSRTSRSDKAASRGRGRGLFRDDLHVRRCVPSISRHRPQKSSQDLALRPKWGS